MPAPAPSAMDQEAGYSATLKQLSVLTNTRLTLLGVARIICGLGWVAAYVPGNGVQKSGYSAVW